MPLPDRGLLVVWSVADALPAVPLDAVVEIAPVGADGRALGRDGALEVTVPPGMVSVAPLFAPP